MNICLFVLAKLWKLLRMQNGGQDFQAVDNARTGSREVGAGVDQIDLSTLCRGQRVESGKFFGKR